MKIEAEERTPKELKELMEKIDREEHDIERKHSWADYVLCQTLKALGYGEAVDIFDNMNKWYA